jgi:hypothetical protein
MTSAVALAGSTPTPSPCFTPRIHTPSGASFLHANTNDDASATTGARPPTEATSARNASAPPALPGMSTITASGARCGAQSVATASCA